MDITIPVRTDSVVVPVVGPHDTQTSAVSWAAIVAGAVTTAAFSLILLTLGTGLKLSSLSPWSPGTGPHIAIKGSTILWLVLMQVIAGSLGGYIAGRLRTRWHRIHGDEVYFRDTAHGFLSWALATVLAAAFLASAATTMIGERARVAPSVVVNESTGGDSGGLSPNGYYVDLLFRGEHPGSSPEADAAVRSEAWRIAMNMVLRDDAPATDRTYLAQLIAARTGLAPSDADRRITDVVQQVRATMDDARRAAEKFSLWMFIALLTGAFCSSAAATVGGDQRDHVVVI